MKKIATRNYRKHYILQLLSATCNNEELPYIATATEATEWNKWLRLLIKELTTDPAQAKLLMLWADKLKKQGGLVASLRTVILPEFDTDLTPNLVYLDLNYAVNKDVQFVFGGVDVTQKVAKSDKLTGLLNRFLKELYQSHEENFASGTRDTFIEELFLVDDVDMVIDEDSRFKIQVDRSLRDYLVALNTRLRISA